MKYLFPLLWLLVAVALSVGLSVAILTYKPAPNPRDYSSLPIKSVGDERLSFIEENGVKEFQLTAYPIRWEYTKGKWVVAWAYNGQIPGPEIRVNEGAKVRIVFTNNLPVATTVHWHGLPVPNDQDGVPGVTQDPIKPGEIYTYEFTAPAAGTFFYHTHGTSHRDGAQQLDMGLSGAFIIEGEEKYVREYTLLLDEWEVLPDGTNAALRPHAEHIMNYNVFTINGKAFPDTLPLKVKEGETVLLRFINAGTSATHPMHLHGQPFTIVAVDGHPVPPAAQLIRDTLPITPGERYDVIVTAKNPGVWMLHCHELHHADGGMIVPFVYEGFTPKKRMPVMENMEHDWMDMPGMDHTSHTEIY